LLVETFTVAGDAVPVAVAGSDEFASNGVEVFAPLIPKAMTVNVPVALIVTVMLSDESAEDATAYHSSMSTSLPVNCLRFVKVRPDAVTDETVGGAASPPPEETTATATIMTSCVLDVLRLTARLVPEFCMPVTLPSSERAICSHLS
jgi:hypothetical protein